MAPSRIVELAAIIDTNTKHVDHYLASKGLPSPSFDPDSPPVALSDSQIFASRQAILDATDELHALMQGPVGILTGQRFNAWISLQAIIKFGLATCFPAGHNATTFAKIAAASGLLEDHVRRILRHAMAFRIFQEPREGIVGHTAASKLLASTPLLRQFMGMISEELWPASTKTIEALSKWPKSEEPNQTGFNIAHTTNVSIFDEMAKYPDRGKRYADAMTFLSSGPGLEQHHVVHTYDWASLGDSTIVDIGGSHGSLSIAIAQAYPSLRFIVQDRPEVVQLGKQNLPSDVRDRVDFMAHSFFDEQPVKDAQVYILRWILHDWSDKYASRILKALVPALRARAKVLILEQIMPEPGAVSAYQEREYR
ncbi:MAG: hypothetical protein Q9212_002634 [Teloschistes hypoglaucus]